MTTDITELAQSLKAAATNVKETAHIARYLKATIARQTFKELMTPDNILALVEALEYYKSREERVTSLVRDNSKSWDELYRQVEAKGKRNVELVEALEKAQQRIAELESRAVKLPKPHVHLIWIQAGHAPDDYWDDVAVSHSEKDRCCDGSERYPVYARWEIEEMLAATGIKVEAE
ncbi:TPA: ead/Ea22-like family protein [Klebsiella pneumoniae]